MSQAEIEAKGWSTEMELQFISHIDSRMDAPRLLRGYIAGMRKRVRFERIDAARAISAANQLLVALEVDERISA